MERITLYTESRAEWNRFVKQLEIDYDEALKADKSEIHQAVIELARENPNEIIEKLTVDN